MAASQEDSQRLSPLSLKINFAWTFLGNALVAVCQLGLLTLLLRETSDAVTGQYIIALSISAPVFMFAGLDLRTLQATDSNTEFRFVEYLGLRLISAAAAFVTVPVIALAVGYRGETFAVILGVALGRAFILIGDTFNGLMQKSERMDRVAHSIVLKGLLATVVLGAVVWTTGNLVNAVFAAAVARLAVLAFYDLPLGARLVRDRTPEDDFSLATLRALDLRRLAGLAFRSLPLAFKVMLVSLDTHVTRYFVAGLGTLASVGVFGPIASGAGSATMVGKALNQSVSAKLGRLATSGRRREFGRFVRRLQLLYLAMGFVGVGFILIFGGPLLALVRPDLLQHQLVLTLVVVSVGLDLQNGIVDMALVAARRIAPLAPACAASVGTSALCCSMLIPMYGLPGAAAAMIIGRIMRMAVLNVALASETRGVPDEMTQTPATHSDDSVEVEAAKSAA